MKKRNVRSVSRGRYLTSEEAAEYRKKVEQELAGMEENIALGRRLIAEKKALVASLQAVIDQLKAERDAQGLSLAELARRTGISRTSLCRLENGQNANPTLESLRRYASAVGRTITVEVGEPV